MAWSTPVTWVSNQVPTATELNSDLRDNMLETLPAKALTDDSYFVATGDHTIEERLWDFETILTEESTSSESFTDLATVGPSVTLETNQRAFAFLCGNIQKSSTTDGSAWMSVEVTGATAFPPTFSEALGFENSGTASREKQMMRVISYTNLTPGTNTFTVKYRKVGTGGSGTYKRRTLIVLPF